MELVTVAAVAENGVVGQDSGLPWPSIPADRRQYRNRTADSPVVLGRRTFESMREDPPGTAQVVLSRSNPSYDTPSVHHATGLEDAVETVESVADGRAYVLGGAEIYELFQPVVDRMLLSQIPGEYDGDAYFPEWDSREWSLVDRTPHDGFTLEEWRRDGTPGHR